LKLQLKDEEEKKTENPAQVTAAAEDEKDEELEQIKTHEKTVNIRFGSYSMLMRAA
jgi:hypothetical protein